VAHAAQVAQTIVEAGARHWAAGAYNGRGFAQVVGRDVSAFVAGLGSAGIR
ncbi:TetR/AcrR family transcriptional regulator, partial [Frankia sp. CNm7]|nr:TetR/AcrR family transcriptional regulator [Frankia nepalensis]MBL7516427.1 TetR/AcrR family transcriptional regulator [Frankia nepalensis]MBL7517954.1 TetR/AcrR family transcriptional regulator [Frankia nepalensis]MBL7625810.1 hypothetical protein [Frankia nepalensis]